MAAWLASIAAMSAPRSLDLKSVEPGLQAGRAQPIGDRVDQVVDLPLDRQKLALFGLQPGALLGDQPRPFRAVGVDEDLDQVGRHDPAGEGVQDSLLQARPAYRALVGAGAMARVVAGEVVLALGVERPAAGAADDLAGEQVARAAAVAEPFGGQVLADRLGGEVPPAIRHRAAAASAAGTSPR
jgi:hypothetical protein